jgi:tetratricopeptide (TPR) repeat protein
MNLGNPLTQLGDFERAAALYQESLALYRELGDRQGMVFPLMNLGGLYYEMGEPRRALEYNEASLALSYELEENDWARGLTWNNIGEAYIALDEPVRAVEVTQHSLQVFMREHDVFGTVTTSFTLGRAYWRLGDVVRARAYLEEAERLYRSLGNHVMAARVLYVHASLALDHGDIPKAREALAQALASLAGQSRTSPYLWWLAERTATLALASGDPNVAGHLYGAALAHREARLGPFEPAEREMRARDLDRLRAALGEPALDAALAVGRGLAPEAAIAQMRSVLAATHRDGA